MAITDIENNELCALSDLQRKDGFVYDDGYYSLLGIGEGRSKAKKEKVKQASLSEANVAFKNSIEKTYNVIKGSKDAKVESAEALTNLKKDGGLENIFLAVQEFGTPVNKNDLEIHNARVNTYIKYEYAQMEGYDCEDLFKLKGIIDTDFEAANRRQSSGSKKSARVNQAEIGALANVKSKVDKLFVNGDCERKMEEAERLKSKEETLSTIQESAKALEGKEDKTLTYVAYGVGGVVLLVAIVMLVRK